MQSIDSVQYYRSAAHIASNSVDHRPGTYSTDSTSEISGICGLRLFAVANRTKGQMSVASIY